MSLHLGQPSHPSHLPANPWCLPLPPYRPFHWHKSLCSSLGGFKKSIPDRVHLSLRLNVNKSVQVLGVRRCEPESANILPIQWAWVHENVSVSLISHASVCGQILTSSPQNCGSKLLNGFCHKHIRHSLHFPISLLCLCHTVQKERRPPPHNQLSNFTHPKDSSLPGGLPI